MIIITIIFIIIIIIIIIITTTISRLSLKLKIAKAYKDSSSSDFLSLIRFKTKVIYVIIYQSHDLSSPDDVTRKVSW